MMRITIINKNTLEKMRLPESLYLKKYKETHLIIPANLINKDIKLVGNTVVEDIDKTLREAKSKVLLRQVEVVEKQFIEDCEEVILYLNKPFKLSYYMLYKQLINTYADEVETYDIYSSNRIDSFEMNKSELTNLSNLLKDTYKTAYDIRKLGIKNAYIEYNK